MSTNLLLLNGCAPTPLAHYLKALGILRLVAEQKDVSCRGAWRDDRFVLLTNLSREDLERFFLEEYRPTALLSPWNGASGFFRTWDDKRKTLRNSKNGEALETLVKYEGARWEPFRVAYQNALKMVAAIAKRVNVDSLTAKDRKRLLIVPTGAACVFPVIDKDEGKEAIQRAMVLGNSSNPFYGSALIDLGGEIKYPSLLGSGGNDGAIDFTARFMENLIQVLPQSGPGDRELLSAALFADPSSGFLTGAAGKVGQFHPGSAGGANATTGFGGQNETHLNPWDFVLLMEGAVLFSAAATRRMTPAAQVQASAPFALRSHSAGSRTMSGVEESARGEQWMPLWDRYLSLTELKSLLSEGRAQVGKSTAARPLDMARAISRLGVARGITAFQRYGYIERNGQSNFAVPLGRIAVTARPRARLADDLVTWLDRLHRLARDRGAPARLGQVERNLADAVFEALTRDDEPSRWQAVLFAAAAVEQTQAAGTGTAAGPIPKLSPEWIAACDDGTSTFRLAVALGSAAAAHSPYGKPFDSLRHHWLPLKPEGRSFATTGRALAHDTRVVAHGRDPEEDLLAVLDRRALESTQKEQRHPRLVAAFRAEAHLADLAAWLAGDVDAVRCTTLARAFFAVDWAAWTRKGFSVMPPTGAERPDDAWTVLRLNALPWPLDEERNIPFDPAIGRRLATGDLPEAVRLALRRLQSHGLRSPLRVVLGDATVARRWGAALAFPISVGTARRLFESLQHKASKENRHVR